MLLMDGVKFHLWEPPNEDEFEQIIAAHAEDIFGSDVKYLDLEVKNLLSRKFLPVAQFIIDLESLNLVARVFVLKARTPCGGDRRDESP